MRSVAEQSHQGEKEKALMQCIPRKVTAERKSRAVNSEADPKARPGTFPKGLKPGPQYELQTKKPELLPCNTLHQASRSRLGCRFRDLFTLGRCSRVLGAIVAYRRLDKPLSERLTRDFNLQLCDRTGLACITLCNRHITVS